MRQELFEIELARHDWGALACACERSAAHLPDAFRRLASAVTDDEADYERIFDQVAISGVLYPVAVPSTAVTLAALAGELSVPARQAFVGLLSLLNAGEDQAPGTGEGRDLPEECVDLTRGAMWLLYSEVFASRDDGTVSGAFEILADLDEDEERVERVREALGERLRWDLRQ